MRHYGLCALVALAALSQVFTLGACGGGGGTIDEGPTIGSLTVPTTQATAAPFDVPSSPQILTQPLIGSVPVVDYAALEPATFSIEGAHFGAYGTPVQVTFLDPGGDCVFDASAGPEVTVDARVTDDGTIQGEMPICSAPHRVEADTLLDVTVTWPDGSEVTAGGLVEYMAPPKIDAVSAMDGIFDPGGWGLDPDEPTGPWILPCLRNLVWVGGGNFDPSAVQAAITILHEGVLIYADTIEPGTRTATEIVGSLHALPPSHQIYDLLKNFGYLEIGVGVRNPDGQWDSHQLYIDEGGLLFVCEGAQRNVSAIHQPGSNAGNSIAVHGVGPETQPFDVGDPPQYRAVVASNDLSEEGDGRRILVSRSADEGHTWSQAIVGPWGSPNSDQAAFPDGGEELEVYARRDPQVVNDRWGNFYVAYYVAYGQDGGGEDEREGVLVMQSRDQGATWGSPYLLLDTPPYAWPYSWMTLGRFGLDVGPRPNDPEQQVLAVTAAFERWGEGYNAWEVLCEGFSIQQHGAGLGEPSRSTVAWVDEYEDVHFANPDVAIGPDGAVHVAFVVVWEDWYDDDLQEQNVIVCTADLDGILDHDFDFADSKYDVGQVTPDEAGRNLWPWHGDWKPILGYDEDGLPLTPRLACVRTGDHAGRLICTWTGCIEWPQLQVLSACSDDHGRTWTPQHPVHPPALADRFLPAMAVDPLSGYVYVSWYEQAEYWPLPGQLLVENPERYVRRMASSSTDGCNWNVPRQLSAGWSSAYAGETSFRRDAGLAAWGHGVWACWADNSFALGLNPDGTGEMDVFVTLFMLLPDCDHIDLDELRDALGS